MFLYAKDSLKLILNSSAALTIVSEVLLGTSMRPDVFHADPWRKSSVAGRIEYWLACKVGNTAELNLEKCKQSWFYSLQYPSSWIFVRTSYSRWSGTELRNSKSQRLLLSLPIRKRLRILGTPMCSQCRFACAFTSSSRFGELRICMQ